MVSCCCRKNAPLLPESSRECKLATFLRRFIKGQKVKDGLGILIWADGSKYQGQFVQGQMQGLGRMIQANGSVYQGQWKNGMANGRGVFIDSKGSTYEGDWMDDHQHGMGAETWEQGKISFQGEYNQGKKNGRGRYEWADGSFYEGDFVDSVFQGQGKWHRVVLPRAATIQSYHDLNVFAMISSRSLRHRCLLLC